MPSRMALGLFARLCAHFPSLGGDDIAATQRARDWCAVIDRSSPETAGTVCTELVEGWAGRFPPKIADWQETTRRVAQQRVMTAPVEVDAPRVDPRAIPLLHEAVEKLRLQRAKHAKPVRVPAGPIDAHHRMPTFDEVYGPPRPGDDK